MSENIDINVNVNTNQAQRNLDNLNKKLGTVNETFASFKQALATVGFGTIIQQTLQWASSIQDVSDATGFAVSNVLAFNQAIEENGGTAEDANKAMNKFLLTLADARDKNKEALEAFNDLNISYEDLIRLSNQQIFDKVINRLSQINDKTLAAARANNIFSRSLAGINLSPVSATYQTATTQTVEYAQGVKVLDDISKDLEVTLKQFRQVIVENIAQPLETARKFIKENIDAIKEFASNIMALIALIAGVTIIKRLYVILVEIVGAFRLAISFITRFTANLRNLTTAIARTENGAQGAAEVFRRLGAAQAASLMGGQNVTNPGLLKGLKAISIVLLTVTAGFELLKNIVQKVFQSIDSSVREFLSNFGLVGKMIQFAIDVGIVAFALLKSVVEKVLGFIIDLFANLFQYAKIGFETFSNIFSSAANTLRSVFGPVIDWLTSKFDKISQKWNKIVTAARQELGLIPEPETAPAAPAAPAPDPEAAARAEREAEAKRKAAEEEAEAKRKAAEQAAAALKRQREEYARFVIQLQSINKNYKANNEELIKSLKLAAEYYNMSQDEIDLAEVKRQIDDNAQATIDQLNESKIGATKEQIKLIDQQIAQTLIQSGLDKERATKYVTNLQTMRNATQDFLSTLDDVQRGFELDEALIQMQEELDLLGLSNEEFNKQNSLIEINRAMRSQMMNLSLQLLKLDEEKDRLNEDFYNKERQRIIQQILDVKTLSDAKKAALLEEIALRKQAENSYLEGTKQAMRDIAESFKPINMAQDVVRKGWGSMENALDEFVDNGKLNFADLARSIINDITKMILKMLVFKAIEAGLNAIFPGAGTAFSALTGKANGGPVNKNTPYVVGERGPELFVPQSAGKIVSNRDLNNKVGEPMQPVTNNVYNNYYINALDAKSVAQLFAENRKAIFGANKMAERELSYGGAR